MRFRVLIGACLASLLLAESGLPCRAAERDARDQPGWFDPLYYRDLARRQFTGWKKPEIVEMLSAVSKGSQMGPGDGWFHDGQTRYTWRWLAERYDINRDGRITRKEFTGPAQLFDRLDTDRNGILTASDLDLSGRSFATMQSMINGFWFRMMDRDSNGRISRDEWNAVFDRISKGRGFLIADDLKEAFPLQPPAPPPDAKPQPQDQGPSPATLLRGLLHGELGSFFEGPDVGQFAPDFTLKTHDGKQTITLSQFRGKKPVVLVFGSFT